MSNQQIDQQYLLMIAMLNFDFAVTVVFNNNALSHWHENEHNHKRLAALQLYGVDTFYLLNSAKTRFNKLSTTIIDKTKFLQLKAEADLIS